MKVLTGQADSRGVATTSGPLGWDTERRKTPGDLAEAGVLLTAPSDCDSERRASAMMVHRPTDRINPPRRKRRTLHDVVDELLPTAACVPWPGTLNREGYGPYKLTYVRHRGPVPTGLILDHLCHSRTRCGGGPTCPHRACVNPAHMEPVTWRENSRRSILTRYGRVSSTLGWPVNNSRCV